MPYQANRDATISKVIGTMRNAEGEKVAHYESVTYPEGAIVFEQDIAPHVLRRLEEGDDHLSSLLRYVDEAEARRILGSQIQDAASEPVDEGEILHQEERMGAEAGNSPSVGPEFNTQGEPPYEPPPAGKGDSGADTGDVPDEATGDGETGDEGTGSTDDEATAEEASDGASDSEGSTTEETSTEATGDAEATETESSASGDSGDGQEDGQVQSDDAPEDESSTEGSDDSGSDGESEAGESPVEDEFSNLDKAGLLAAAKEAKIPKRTKMDEDQLRAALREKAK